MGGCAENTVKAFKLSREQQDEISRVSVERARAAHKVPLMIGDKKLVFLFSAHSSDSLLR